MPRKQFNFTTAFVAIVLSLSGCSREEEDENYYDDGQGIHYMGGFYPYGTTLPGGYRSEPGLRSRPTTSAGRVINGKPPIRTSTTTRGGFSGRGSSGAS